MSFHPIALTLPTATTWNESGAGRYMLSTVTFGNPLNYINVSPGTRSSKVARTNAAITRFMQKDVTVGTVTTRRTMSMQLVLQVDDGFTSLELDNSLIQLNEFVTVASLDRILNGER